MKRITLLSFTCLLLFAKCNSLFFSDPVAKPETDMDMVETIKFNGFPVETHEVTTEDGYILTNYRIPRGVKNTQEPRPVVILQHGLLDSSFTWVNNGPEKSLAFILAENGYDVWLPNSRGNLYSKRHTTLSPSSKKFWEFTWDEMAKHDLPASINYAMKTSKVSKLGYVGHSQGGAIGLAAFSNNDDLKTKVSAYVGLAPAAYLGHMKSPLKLLAPVSGGIGVINDLLLGGEFLPNIELVTMLSQAACGNVIVSSAVCNNIAFILQGFNTENLNASRMPIYLSHVPAGTSTMNLLHFSQVYSSKKFQYYDFGWIGNLKNYETRNPPQYKLDTRPVPTAIFYGGNDWLVDPQDSNITIKELGPAVTFTKYIPRYNHIDFVWGMDAFEVVYRDVINFLNKYNQ